MLLWGREKLGEAALYAELMGEGEALLEHLRALIRGFARSKAEGEKIGNPKLVEATSMYIPVLERLASELSIVLSLVNDEKFIVAKEHACSLERKAYQLYLNVLSSAPLFIRGSLISILLRIRDYSGRMCGYRV